MLSLLSITSVFAQDRTMVTANNSEISDNLDLRAVASIFGDSNNLDDFERRLNDPKAQISNLDLNRDNQVDYLRVIETVEGNAHLIVIQSVLGRDSFQDIATVEVERGRNNRVQVQVVGDVFMYGNNYIYEPIFAYNPVIYNSFWASNYQPYFSSWNWGFYPSFYYAWTPFPIFTYQNHINIHINNYHHYNYANFRRCGVAYNNYFNGRRGNAYEIQYPNRSFSNRNNGYANRYELDNNGRNRGELTSNSTRVNSTRGNNTRTETPRTYGQNGNSTRGNNTRTQTPRTYGQNGNGTRENNTRTQTPRTYSQNGNDTRGNNTGTETPRSYGQNGNGSRGNNTSTDNPRTYGQNGNGSRGNNTRTETPRTNSQNGNSNPRSEMPRNVQTQRGNSGNNEAQRNSNQRELSQKRGNSQKSDGNSRGNKRV